jgi:lysozyme family protein
MTLDEVLERVLVREGWPKYTDDPNDRGGPTKGGVTLKTLNAWRGRSCTREELRALEKPEALLIFRRMYAEVRGIDLLAELPVRAQVVDNAILSGPRQAVKDLQRVVGATPDGYIGKKTMKAVMLSGVHLDNALAVRRTKRLVKIVANNRRKFKQQLEAASTLAQMRKVVREDQDQSTFANGWVDRSLEFVDASSPSTGRNRPSHST